MRRLYRAVCGLIEAHAHNLSQPSAEPQHEVDMHPTQAETVGQFQREELDQDTNREIRYYAETGRVGFTAPIGPRPEEHRA